MVKKISDNEIYFLIKYIKSVLWRVAKRLSYIEDARCLKVKHVWIAAWPNTLENFTAYLCSCTVYHYNTAPNELMAVNY